ncbi:MAG: SUMF1/EgtB/PvdO family nonheme iron enzyme [Nitrospirae bacterium]|nr:SUMF1/EgtB/PvdO family nonheme iron enzyme [Nitrospirota bacterium]
MNARRPPVLLLLSALLLSACAVPQGMSKVKGGTFHMGTDMVDTEGEALAVGLPEPFYADEHPFHPVRLRTFLMDTTEVTNARYQEFITATPHVPAPLDWSRRTAPQGKEDHPVVYVSWADAQHFCAFAGGRLPTEAEWEAAARGPEMRIYPWGNTWDPAKANVSTGPFDRGRTLPVGSLPAGAGPYGHLDLIGNVWEWVNADYAPYPGNDAPIQAFMEGYKVMRGLGFEAVGHYLPEDYARVMAISARSSFRGFDHPGARLRDVGFRCLYEPRPVGGG